MNAAPPQLLLSVLTWTGKPTFWTAGDSDEYIGSYIDAMTVQLNKTGINTRFKTVEYTPVTPAVFQYKRHAHVGEWPDIWESAVFGADIPPLVRICLAGSLPWPEQFNNSSLNDDVRNHLYKNFQNSSIDLYRKTAHGMDGIRLSFDLPGQPEHDCPNLAYGHELEFSVGLGWHGPWVMALLDRQDQDQPLGVEEKIVWDTGNNITRQTTWGMQVRLQVIDITELNPDVYEEVDDDDAVPSRGISSYEIRATISRVFVKNTWFVEQNNSIESGEDEGEDMDLEDRGDGEEEDGEEEEDDDDEGMDSEYE
ncbi:hypothetical protein C8R45DRAFT_1083686 [Mycena sanguinolenta]|nr:hypothetical protein C8R45DRAFT_1083686 [Mycena sanguinolenta]